MKLKEYNFYKNYKSSLSEIKYSISKGLMDRIYSSKTITVLITLFILILFNEQLTSLVNEVIVENVFSEIEAKPLFDFIFILLFLFVLIFLIRKAYIGFQPSFIQKYLSGILVFEYLYNRLDKTPYWTFEEFYAPWLSLYYIDILSVLLVFPISRVIMFHIKREDIDFKSSLFIEDLPLIDKESDSLGRSEYAKEIATLVSNQHFEKAFSIGILGPWGAGKTSFLNMINCHLKKEESIFIEFNAFHNHDENAIIDEFFKVLSNSIKKYSSELSQKLKRYGKHVIKAANSKNLELIYDAFELINNEKVVSIQHQYQKINNLLKKLRLKLVISIDDVDRLESQEIIQLFKLIRNTANFDNTIYIVGLDKEYVINAIKENNESKNRKFIEKFFQYEFILPPFNRHKIRSKFFELISKDLTEEMQESVRASIFPTSIISSTLFDRRMSSYRDVIRLANVFRFDLQNIIGEVDLRDMINLAILKSKYPSIYLMLASDIDMYLDKKVWGKVTYYIQRRFETKSEKEKNGKKVLIYKLNERKNQLGLTENNIDEIEDIFNSLFSEVSSHFYNISHLSIKRTDKLDIYITARLLGGGISEKEFIDSFSSTEKIRIKIKSWINENKEASVIDRLSNVKVSGHDEYFKVLDALFFIGTNTEDFYAHKYAIDEIGNNLDITYLLKHSIIKNEEEVGEFIVEEYLDKYTNYPFEFESEFLSRLLVDNTAVDGEILGIKLDKYSDIMFNYLKSYSKQLMEFDWYVFRLFSKNNQHGKKQEGVKVFKQLIKRLGIEKFYPMCIDREPFDRSYKIANSTKEIFGTLDDFEKFVFDSEMSDQTEEFKLFYRISKLFGFSSFVKFDFQKITLRDYGRGNMHEENQIWILLDIEETLYQELLKDQSNFFGKLNASSVQLEFPSKQENLLFLIYQFHRYPKQREELQYIVDIIKPYVLKLGVNDKDVLITLKRPFENMISDKQKSYVNLNYVYPSID